MHMLLFCLLLLLLIPRAEAQLVEFTFAEGPGTTSVNTGSIRSFGNLTIDTGSASMSGERQGLTFQQRLNANGFPPLDDFGTQTTGLSTDLIPALGDAFTIHMRLRLPPPLLTPPAAVGASAIPRYILSLGNAPRDSANAFACQFIDGGLRIYHDNTHIVVVVAFPSVNGVPQCHGTWIPYVPDTEMSFVYTVGPFYRAYGAFVANRDPWYGTIPYTMIGSMQWTPARLKFQPLTQYSMFYGTIRRFAIYAGTFSTGQMNTLLVMPPPNSMPVAIQTMDTQALEDTPVAFSLQCTDVDGDSCVYDVTQLPASGVIQGIAHIGDRITGPGIYTPAPDTNGVDVIRFRPVDSRGKRGAEAVHRFMVAAVNDPPIANNVTVEYRRDAITIPISGVDIDGTVYVARILTLPDQGQLTVNQAPLIVGSLVSAGLGEPVRFYIANASVPSTAPPPMRTSFLFAVQDNSGAEAIGEAVIVISYPSFVPPLTELTTREDEAVEIDLHVSGVDLTARPYVISGPASGVAHAGGVDTGYPFYASEITWTPPAHQSGYTASFVYVAKGYLESLPGTVRIAVTPVNDPPVLSAVTPAAGTTDVAIPVTISDADESQSSEYRVEIEPPTFVSVSITPGPNITYVVGDGSRDGRLVFTAPPAAARAALGSLVAHASVAARGSVRVLVLDTSPVSSVLSNELFVPVEFDAPSLGTESSSSSAGAIAGGVVGGLTGVVAIGGAIWWWRR
jgi:hypothetical protein